MVNVKCWWVYGLISLWVYLIYSGNEFLDTNSFFREWIPWQSISLTGNEFPGNQFLSQGMNSLAFNLSSGNEFPGNQSLSQGMNSLAINLSHREWIPWQSISLTGNEFPGFQSLLQGMNSLAFNLSYREWIPWQQNRPCLRHFVRPPGRTFFKGLI